MSEYETQFNKLSKFAPELMVIEQRRVKRFVQGLNMEIQETLATAQVNIFMEALEKTQMIENTKVQVRASKHEK